MCSSGHDIEYIEMCEMHGLGASPQFEAIPTIFRPPPRALLTSPDVPTATGPPCAASASIPPLLAQIRLCRRAKLQYDEVNCDVNAIKTSAAGGPAERGCISREVSLNLFTYSMKALLKLGKRPKGFPESRGEFFSGVHFKTHRCVLKRPGFDLTIWWSISACFETHATKRLASGIQSKLRGTLYSKGKQTKGNKTEQGIPLGIKRKNLL